MDDLALLALVMGVNENGGQTKERRFSTACEQFAQGAGYFPNPEGSSAILPGRRAVGNRPSLKKATRSLTICPSLSFTPLGDCTLNKKLPIWFR